MKKILLAIDGIAPDEKAFRYALQLCQRIRAELNVFQIINSRNYGEYLKKIRKGTGQARRYIESSMVAATFGEAGEHETAKEIMAAARENINRLLPESEEQGVQCHFTIKSGSPDKEIVDYVNTHREVVLTIYDAPVKGPNKRGMRKEASVFRKLTEALCIPLVVMRS
jgi:nucleotide-binding universal stress UspA family protein